MKKQYILIVLMIASSGIISGMDNKESQCSKKNKKISKNSKTSSFVILPEEGEYKIIETKQRSYSVSDMYANSILASPRPTKEQILYDKKCKEFNAVITDMHICYEQRPRDINFLYSQDQSALSATIVAVSAMMITATELLKNAFKNAHKEIETTSKTQQEMVELIKKIKIQTPMQYTTESNEEDPRQEYLDKLLEKLQSGKRVNFCQLDNCLKKFASDEKEPAHEEWMQLERLVGKCNETLDDNMIVSNSPSLSAPSTPRSEIKSEKFKKKKR